MSNATTALPHISTVMPDLSTVTTETIQDTFVSGALLLLFCSVVASLFITHWARHSRILWMQPPLVSTSMGFFVGFLLWFVVPKGRFMLDGILSFNDQVFFIALLPPVIFYSGFCLVGAEGEHFLINFGAILWFAVFGTFISFVAIGFLTFALSSLYLCAPFSLREALAFGAAISSTDPVVALTIFKDVGAPPLLVSILSGESLMNDALSILLYRALFLYVLLVALKLSVALGLITATLLLVLFEPSMATSTQQFNSLISWLWDFFWVLFCSMTLGVIVGLTSALVYKYVNLHQDANRLLESALFLVFPWICYLVSDGVGMSAIVSILFSGMTMARYTYPNLSSLGKETAKNVFGALALLTESTIFVLLGLAVFSAEHPRTFDWRLYIVTPLIVTASRCLSVYLTSLIVNWFRPEPRRLPVAYQWMLCFCGARGAVAFALALGSRHDFGTDVGSRMLSATLFYAILSIVVISLSLSSVVNYVALDMDLVSFQRKQLLSDFDEKQQEGLAPTPLSNKDALCYKNSSGNLQSPLASLSSLHSSISDTPHYISARDILQASLSPTEELTSSLTTAFRELLVRLDQRIMQPVFLNTSFKHDGTTCSPSQRRTRFVSNEIEFTCTTVVRPYASPLSNTS